MIGLGVKQRLVINIFTFLFLALPAVIFAKKTKYDKQDPKQQRDTDPLHIKAQKDVERLKRGIKRAKKKMEKRGEIWNKLTERDDESSRHLRRVHRAEDKFNRALANQLLVGLSKKEKKSEEQRALEELKLRPDATREELKLARQLRKNSLDRKHQGAVANALNRKATDVEVLAITKEYKRELKKLNTQELLALRAIQNNERKEAKQELMKMLGMVAGAGAVMGAAGVVTGGVGEELLSQGYEELVEEDVVEQEVEKAFE